jgi:hypothetical protein
MEILKMTKRLYFTCPIKAMYMNHYFGVKFMPPANSNNCEVHELAQETIMYLREDCEDCMENWKKQLDEAGKFFVAPESEHIFEPKSGDLDADGFCFTSGMPITNQMTGKIDYHTDACWLLQIEEFSRSKEKSKTICRDSKQFFMPEVENEK